MFGIVQSIIGEDLKEGLEIIEKTLHEGYDVNQIYKGLLLLLRNMMIIKVYEGLPPFLYMGEEQYQRIGELVKGIEYYEVQNMVHYMLKSEDLLRGLFPKVSLETIYINLYNISKLRDVEKVLDNLEGHEERGGSPQSLPDSPARQTPPQKERPREETVKEEALKEETVTPPGGTEPDIEGFVEYVKKKKPFVGGIFESMEMRIENDGIVLNLDKKYGTFVNNELADIKTLLREYFGKEMALVMRDAVEKKKSVLEEYVKEAESLFKL